MVSILYVYFMWGAVRLGRRMNTKLLFVEYIYKRYISHPYVRYEDLLLESISVLDGGECSAMRRLTKRSKDLRIGSWNVLSLYRSKSLQMLLDQLEKYYMDINCVQEMK
jgi:hypothetical protein